MVKLSRDGRVGEAHEGDGRACVNVVVTAWCSSSPMPADLVLQSGGLSMLVSPARVVSSLLQGAIFAGVGVRDSFSLARTVAQSSHKERQT